MVDSLFAAINSHACFDNAMLFAMSVQCHFHYNSHSYSLYHFHAQSNSSSQLSAITSNSCGCCELDYTS